MKLKRNFFPIVVAILMGVIHQSCLEQVDLETSHYDGFVVDAKLVYPHSLHVVSISEFNNNIMAYRTNKFSIKLTDDNGKTIFFRDVQKIPKDSVDYYYPIEVVDSVYDSYNEEYYYYYDTVEKGKKEDRDRLLSLINSEDDFQKRFVAINQELEVGRVYTLSITIDDKEYTATEKLLPPLEITCLKYKIVQREKSIWEGMHNMLCPTFSFVNKAENESKYFLAKALTGSSGGIRLFQTENMNDTIKELQFREFNYDPKFELGNVPFSNSDDWYLDDYEWWDALGDNQHGIDYGFYPLSKANYEFYNAIEKQIRTDGGIYNQSASTPESNFTGGTIYGQFIVTSESVINSKKAVNRSDLLEIIHANN